jgi:GTPase Era involved in 16S rRNA processing
MCEPIHTKKRGAFESFGNIDLKPISKKFDVLQSYLEVLGKNEYLEHLNNCRELLKQKKVVIMITGEFSVGKSSFLNALLGDPVLVTDVQETTAVITYLHNVRSDPAAKPNQAKITYTNGKVKWKPIDQEVLKKVTTALNKNDANKRVERVDLFFDEERLPIPENVTIVDTPGLNGNDIHTKLTRRQMALSHIALFLFNAERIGSESEKLELQKLYEYAPEVFFIVTKWDNIRNSYPEGITQFKREGAMNAVGKVVGNRLSDDKLFIVSSKEAIQYVQDLRNLPEEAERLPIPNNNDFFYLKNQLMAAMRDRKLARSILRQPLMALRFLAEECLQEFKRIEQKYAKVKKNTEIESERKKISEYREKMKGAHEKVSHVAEDLIEAELSCCSLLIEEFKDSLRSKLNTKVNSLNESEITSKRVQTEMKSYVSKLIEDSIGKPINDVFKAMCKCMIDILKTGQHKLDNSKFNSLLSESFAPVLQFEKDSGLGKLITGFETGIEAADREIQNIQTKMSELRNTVLAGDNAQQNAWKLGSEIDDLNQKINRMGRCPEPKETEHQVSYKVKIDEGFFENPFGVIFSFFTGDTPTKSVTKYRTEVSYDYSNVRHWETKISNLSSQKDQCISDKKRQNTKISAGNKAQKKISRLDLDLNLAFQRKEEAVKSRDREIEDLKKRKSKEQKQGFLRQWNSETSRAVEAIQGSLETIPNTIRQAINDYRERTEKGIAVYLEKLSDRERDLHEKKKKNDEDYKQVVSSIEGLEKFKK